VRRALFHDPRYRGWVEFRFPENLDYDHLVQVQRADPKLPEEISAQQSLAPAAGASSSPTTAFEARSA
jgi:hypothetical protein